MNTEVTQTQGEGDKQDLARYEYRSHTSSRRGRQNRTLVGMNTEVTQTQGEGDKQGLARYEYRSHTNSRRGEQTAA
jgi:hypothetical protein